MEPRNQRFSTVSYKQSIIVLLRKQHFPSKETPCPRQKPHFSPDKQTIFLAKKQHFAGDFWGVPKLGVPLNHQFSSDFGNLHWMGSPTANPPGPPPADAAAPAPRRPRCAGASFHGCTTCELLFFGPRLEPQKDVSFFRWDDMGEQYFLDFFGNWVENGWDSQMDRWILSVGLLTSHGFKGEWLVLMVS